MKNRKFRLWSIAVLGLCLALTLAHFVYIVYAYRHCSIIYFIGKELW